MQTTEEQIRSALRHIRRTGLHSLKLFNNKISSGDKFISAEEALSLYNNYGIDAKAVIFMVDSHGLTIDDLTEFEMLIEGQKEQQKKSIQC